MAVDTIHQCPRCELRFANRTELEDHLRTDHVPAVADDVPAAPRAVAGIVTVPIDPTRPPTLAVPIAAAVARQAGMGVDIVAAPPRWSATPSLAASVQDALATGAPEAHGELLATTDDPAAVIIDHVGRGDTALVCMATRGRSPVGQVVLGSVSAAVVRSSPVPVLLVGPDVLAIGARVERLVACLDGTPVAERVLPAAAELAQRLSAELVLIQVVTSEPIADSEPSELAYLRDAAGNLPGPPPRFEVLRDRHPVSAIAGYGGDRGDTIIVMATHGRSGLRRVVMGSVALGVTHEAKCPVLVVPPRATAAD